MNWLDNADSYICPVCHTEINNPARYDYRCPGCGFVADSDREKSKKSTRDMPWCKSFGTGKCKTGTCKGCFVKWLQQPEEKDEQACETCTYFPPSSCDGKPCSLCDLEDPKLDCYQMEET